MRAATFETKIKNMLEESSKRENVMVELLFKVQHGVKQALLEHFIKVYMEKFKLYKPVPVNEQQHALLCVNNAFVIIKNVMTETIIMCCYKDECNMFYYDEKSTHVQKRAYRFWLDDALVKLVKQDVATAVCLEWQALHSDVLIYLARFLPTETLLNCTLVNKWWREVLIDCPQIWHCTFDAFIKSNALFHSLEAPCIEACLTRDIPFGLKVLQNIAAAWLYHHRDLLHSYDLDDLFTPGSYPSQDMLDHHQEREPEKKRLKLLEDQRTSVIAKRHQLSTARHLIGNSTHYDIDWRNTATSQNVNAHMSGTIENGHGHVAAVVWLGADGVLKIADLRAAKGYVKAKHAKQFLYKMMYNYRDYENNK